MQKRADISYPTCLMPLQCDGDASGKFKVISLRFLFYHDMPDVIFLERKGIKDYKDNIDTF